MSDTQQPSPTFTAQQFLLAIREAFLYNDRSMGLEKKWLSVDIAKDIELADPQKLVFTVDWDSEISFAPLGQDTHNAVAVWQSSEYRSTYDAHLVMKELSEKERQQSYRYVEIRDRLRRKVVREFFTTGVEGKTKDIVENMVDKLIQSRSETVAAYYKIDFRDLLQADQDLTEFKKKNKIK